MYKVGNDITRISRFESRISNLKFVQNVLSITEFNKYNELNKNDKILFLAKRWCFKEAYLKMLGMSILNYKIFQDLTLVNKKGQKPYLKQDEHVDVSISHEDDYLYITCVKGDKDVS